MSFQLNFQMPAIHFLNFHRMKTLLPFNYHMLGQLKNSIRDKCSKNDEVLQTTV
jgi:hypothetical protein